MCTPDLESLYKIRLNLQCPSTLERGRGELGRREFPVFECLPYLPLPPSYLVLEVLIQNGEFYININMHQQQQVDIGSALSTIATLNLKSLQRFTFISERNIRGRIINDQIYILFMIYHRILGIKTGPKLMVVLEEL